MTLTEKNIETLNKVVGNGGFAAKVATSILTNGFYSQKQAMIVNEVIAYELCLSIEFELKEDVNAFANYQKESRERQMAAIR